MSLTDKKDINITPISSLGEFALIDKLTEAHLDSTVEMSTLVSTQLSTKDYDNESIVKAFLDEHNFATDFKRRSVARYKHLGIYGFTKKTLLPENVFLPENRFHLKTYLVRVGPSQLLSAIF